MKKVLSITLALALACGMLASCAKKPVSTPASTPASTPMSEPVKEDATQMKADITWWVYPTFASVNDTVGKYEEGIVAEFNKKFPNIKVSVEMLDFTNGPEKTITAIQGKTAPDVLFDAPGRIIDYGTSGYLASLDDLFTDEFVNDVTSKGLLSSCSDGKTYWMYPISAAPFTMALNKTILEKEGLLDMAPTTGERTWTTDQYIALSKALAAKGYKNAEIFCGGQGGDQGTRAFITNLYGATVMDDMRTEYTMTTPNAIKSVELLNTGVKEGWMQANTAGVANDSLDHFDQGAVTMSILWGPGLAKGRVENMKASGVEAISVALPSDDGVPVLEYLVNGFGVFNNGDENKIAASKELVKFLCDDEMVGKQNVVATGCFPVRSSFGDLYPGDAEMAYYNSLAKYYGTYYNTVPGFASMRPFWWGSLQAMFTGEKTPAQAMEYFVKEANPTLTE